MSALGANGDPLLLGSENHADSATVLTRDTVPSTNAATFVAETTISAAVVGHATSGQGVIGRSDSSAGVQGYSDTDAGVNGFGVYGVWATGDAVGGFFTTSGGVALQAAGRTKLSTSGVTTIQAGNTSKTISPGVDVTSGSFLLLTPKANIGSRGLWFTTDAANNRFTIRMSSARPSATKVAWLLLG